MKLTEKTKNLDEIFESRNFYTLKEVQKLFEKEYRTKMGNEKAFEVL